MQPGEYSKVGRVLVHALHAFGVWGMYVHCAAIRQLEQLAIAGDPRTAPAAAHQASLSSQQNPYVLRFAFCPVYLKLIQSTVTHASDGAISKP